MLTSISSASISLFITTLLHLQTPLLLFLLPFPSQAQNTTTTTTTTTNTTSPRIKTHTAPFGPGTVLYTKCRTPSPPSSSSSSGESPGRPSLEARGHEATWIDCQLIQQWALRNGGLFVLDRVFVVDDDGGEERGGKEEEEGGEEEEEEENERVDGEESAVNGNGNGNGNGSVSNSSLAAAAAVVDGLEVEAGVDVELEVDVEVEIEREKSQEEEDDDDDDELAEEEEEEGEWWTLLRRQGNCAVLVRNDGPTGLGNMDLYGVLRDVYYESGTRAGSVEATGLLECGRGEGVRVEWWIRDVEGLGW